MSTVNTNGQIGSREYEDFLVPNTERLTNSRTVASGQVLEARQVVALNASGEIVAFDTAALAPENAAFGIMVESADASTASVAGYYYVTATVNENKLIFSNSADQVDDALRDALRSLGIYLVGSVGS